jgi:hypothetical protein
LTIPDAAISSVLTPDTINKAKNVTFFGLRSGHVPYLTTPVIASISPAQVLSLPSPPPPPPSLPPSLPSLPSLRSFVLPNAILDLLYTIGCPPLPPPSLLSFPRCSSVRSFIVR